MSDKSSASWGETRIEAAPGGPTAAESGDHEHTASRTCGSARRIPKNNGAIVGGRFGRRGKRALQSLQLLIDEPLAFADGRARRHCDWERTGVAAVNFQR